MDPNEVGAWRFCPACARPILPEDGERIAEGFDLFLEDIRCSCCERPWIACPCTPVSEGECKSILHEEGDKNRR